MLYHDGTRMLEGARSGLGIITGAGVLVTAGRDVLASVTRDRTLRVAGCLMPIELRDIIQVDDRAIGDGQVGPHAKRLIQAFGREVDDYPSNVGI